MPLLHGRQSSCVCEAATHSWKIAWSATKQDYPDYQLHVVVDNRHDPAWKVAESLANRYGADRVCIKALDERHNTCSLKCSAVTQAIGRLDGSFQAAALVDADTMPHRSWLSELTTPLADEHIGTATGNRWYMPGAGSWGARCDIFGMPRPLSRCIGTKYPGAERLPSKAR